MPPLFGYEFLVGLGVFVFFVLFGHRGGRAWIVGSFCILSFSLSHIPPFKLLADQIHFMSSFFSLFGCRECESSVNMYEYAELQDAIRNMKQCLSCLCNFCLFCNEYLMIMQTLIISLPQCKSMYAPKCHVKPFTFPTMNPE